MPETRLEPYTSLRPFRRLFEEGLPVLTYHKLGPRPRGARLKGLYVSQRLFRSQLVELREAGFQSGSLSALNDGSAFTAAKRIVITFDDGFLNVLDFGLPPLAQTGFHAIQFLVADHLGRRNEWDLDAGEAPAPLMDDSQVREWLSAGHEIGSHTRTHPRLTRLSPAQAREEITSSRKILEDRFGRAVEHFCYPYGDWNEKVRELVAGAGYRTACTTEPGVNTRQTDLLALKRFTARYASRNWRAFWRRIVQRWRA